MNSHILSIPTRAWYGDEPLPIAIPDHWQLQICHMRGHENKPLSAVQIRNALLHPFGNKKLSEIARGKKRIAILFDDLARPTPASEIIPFLLEEIAKANISSNQIRFIAASGNHAPMRQSDVVKKLGHDIVKRYHVYYHNPFKNLVNLGKTSSGTPLFINREAASCDLKIGIGTVLPHHSAVFGGGAKIIMPGITGISTATHLHRIAQRTINSEYHDENDRYVKASQNILKLNSEEAAKIVGLDMKIDLLVNHRREIIGIFAGHYLEEHRAAIKEASRIYATPVAENCDIVITNTYPLENMIGKGVWPARYSLKEGGHLVIIRQAGEGEILHYLSGRQGTDYGGDRWKKPAKITLSAQQRILLFSSFVSRADLDLFEPRSNVIICPDWQTVLDRLSSAYPSDSRPKVALYPYAAMQYPLKNLSIKSVD